ncbi:single-stranded DNA-binding protein [uncultured Megasphaera sp.]|jgi:single-strand DNA-binding protein|uniref:single-stranded DNA-binding protein n=1 Tax=uncultured Megasphaera sp. TaxID=165188 RepID=UPI002670B21D|nr:single-stranded DNA-binding protein [uncultured Megasphaera sp.]
MNTSFFGRLTRDPEVKTSQNGSSNYTTLSVATTVRSKDQDGKNKTIFVNAIAFGKSGEIISQYFRKGSRIVVHGDINDLNAWIGKQDNQAHAGLDISVTGFDFVDTKAENEHNAQPPAQGYQQPPAQPYQAPGQQGYAMPPQQGQAAPPAQPYGSIPGQGYAQPPAQGYQQPPAQTYQAPPAQGYAAPPTSPQAAPAPPYNPSAPTHSPF